MERTPAATVPVKLSLSGSKRRSRLDVPLKFTQLCQKVRSTFPDVKNFKLEYVDEEGDNIIVGSDADLEEARSVFEDLGRVPSFIVKNGAPAPAAAPVHPSSRTTNTDRSRCGYPRRYGCGRQPLHKSFDFTGRHGCGQHHPMYQVLKFPAVQEGLKSLFGKGPVLHFGITCDGSNQHPLVGKRYHKIGHDYDLNETEFAKLSRGEQEKYEVIDFPGAIPVPVKKVESKPDKSQPKVIHFGVMCDGSGQNPLLGVRYHKIGHNYDLNETEFVKLPLNEQQKYEMIPRPGATPVPVAKAPNCAFVRDVTIPDGQVISPGKQFKKTWLVKTGVTGWPAGCTLTHVCGDKMCAPHRVALGPQKPHSLVQVSVDFTAPTRAGKTTSKWRVAGPNGKLFGHTLWASIVVKPAESSATVSSATATAMPVENRRASTCAAAAAAVPASVAPATSGALQQLLEMGFAVPVGTLQRVLDSVGGNVPAAVATLFSKRDL